MFQTLATNLRNSSRMGMDVFRPEMGEFSSTVTDTFPQAPQEALLNYMGVVLKIGFKIHEAQKTT